MKKYRAVIFDLDGTLVNTLYDIANSTNQALKEFSLPIHPVESFRLKVGTGNRDLVSACLGPDKQDLLDAVADIQIKHYAEHFCDNSLPYPGIVEMLTELKNQKLKLAVLSNKPAPFGPKLVEHVFKGKFFAVVQGQTDGVPFKPDPTSALAIAKKLGVPPAQTAFVGDSSVDMQTARNASMLAVGVTWGFRDPEELQQNGAQALIDHPGEILDILQ